MALQKHKINEILLTRNVVTILCYNLINVILTWLHL